MAANSLPTVVGGLSQEDRAASPFHAAVSCVQTGTAVKAEMECEVYWFGRRELDRREEEGGFVCCHKDRPTYSEKEKSFFQKTFFWRVVLESGGGLN